MSGSKCISNSNTAVHTNWFKDIFIYTWVSWTSSFLSDSCVPFTSAFSFL